MNTYLEDTVRHEWLIVSLGGHFNNFNICLYSASIGHSIFYFTDMTYIDEEILSCMNDLYCA